MTISPSSMQHSNATRIFKRVCICLQKYHLSPPAVVRRIKDKSHDEDITDSQTDNRMDEDGGGGGGGG